MLTQQLKTHTITELGERLEELLLYISKDNKEKSLMASIKLSLEHLTPKQRELVKRLGVFQGCGLEAAILEITEINKTEWTILRSILENTGLIQSEDLTKLGINSPYLKFHPALATTLWQELNNSQQNKLLTQYRKSYYQFSESFSFKDAENPYSVRAVILRELPNLLYALHTALREKESFAVLFTIVMTGFLDALGLQHDRTAIQKIAKQMGNDIGSNDWFLTQLSEGQLLVDTGQDALAESIFRDLLQRLEQMPSHQFRATHILILSSLGGCFKAQNKIIDAIKCYQQALALAHQLKKSTEIQLQISILHNNLADVFRDSGGYAQAMAHYDEAYKIATEIKDIRIKAQILSGLGTLLMLTNGLQQAKDCYQTARELFKDLNEPRSEAIVLHQLGRVYQQEQAWQEAEKYYRESAEIAETQDNLARIAMTYNQLAIVTKAQGKIEAAESWYRHAIEKFETINDKKNLADGLNNLADLLQKQPDRLNEARQLAEKSLAIHKSLGKASMDWHIYELLAKIADKQQKKQQAKHYRQLSRNSYLHFSGMLYQMQQYAPFINMVVQAVISQKNGSFKEVLELQNELAELSEQSGEDGRQNLINAVQYIFNGERNEETLLEPLNYQDTAIVHLILQGTANPDSLQRWFDS